MLLLFNLIYRLDIKHNSEGCKVNMPLFIYSQFKIILNLMEGPIIHRNIAREKLEAK